SREFWIGGS
ncbi:HNH endonuclease family protein, partial [Vibrio parahaemolyticus V-223/04]